jgi:hypothetical protein
MVKAPVVMPQKGCVPRVVAAPRSFVVVAGGVPAELKENGEKRPSPAALSLADIIH